MCKIAEREREQDLPKKWSFLHYDILDTSQNGLKAKIHSEEKVESERDSERVGARTGLCLRESECVCVCVSERERVRERERETGGVGYHFNIYFCSEFFFSKLSSEKDDYFFKREKV